MFRLAGRAAVDHAASLRRRGGQLVGKHKRIFLASCGTAALLVSAFAGATETVSYSYDALGRLTNSVISGGPNNTIGTATCFDPAGNRTRYSVGAGVNVCGTSPTPTPTPTASPPVAVADTVSGACNTARTYNVVANDYDPNGNVPLSLVSVTSNSNVSAAVISSTTIQFVGTVPGNTSTLHYVIKNSLNVNATGTITYKTTGTQSTCYQ